MDTREPSDKKGYDKRIDALEDIYLFYLYQ